MPMSDVCRNGTLSHRVSSASGSRQQKSYKVVMESITQEKKRLVSSVSYNVQAPSGYTFVPVGTGGLTEFCKEECRKRGLSVYVVTAASKKAHTIAHHTQRVGHHFPNAVVEKACQWLNVEINRKKMTHGDPYPHSRSSSLTRNSDRTRPRNGLAQGDATSAQQRQQVKATVKELFPKIPEADVAAIVSRAFEEGTGRVGEADHLTLSRKVQLAVVAHIRHVYTDYDQLLKIVSWPEARQMVEGPCLDQIVKWRGETDNDDIELEDIFQEVIVLDDDDADAEKDGLNDQSRVQDREPSLEIISYRKLAADLQNESSDSDYGHDRQSPRQLQHDEHNSQHRDLVHVRPQRDPRISRLLHREELYLRYNEARARNGLPRNVTAYRDPPPAAYSTAKSIDKTDCFGPVSKPQIRPWLESEPLIRERHLRRKLNPDVISNNDSNYYVNSSQDVVVKAPRQGNLTTAHIPSPNNSDCAPKSGTHESQRSNSAGTYHYPHSGLGPVLPLSRPIYVGEPPSGNEHETQWVRRVPARGLQPVIADPKNWEFIVPSVEPITPARIVNGKYAAHQSLTRKSLPNIYDIYDIYESWPEAEASWKPSRSRRADDAEDSRIYVDPVDERRLLDAASHRVLGNAHFVARSRNPERSEVIDLTSSPQQPRINAR